MGVHRTWGRRIRDEGTRQVLSQIKEIQQQNINCLFRRVSAVRRLKLDKKHDKQNKAWSIKINYTRISLLLTAMHTGNRIQEQQSA